MVVMTTTLGEISRGNFRVSSHAPTQKLIMMEPTTGIHQAANRSTSDNEQIDHMHEQAIL